MNAMLITSLQKQLPRLAPSVSPTTVIRSGALGVNHLADSPQVIEEIRRAWATAVAEVNILLVTIICVSVLTALGMSWLSVKEMSE